MSPLPFEHDVFISYAHVDNIAPESERGWVQQFQEQLRIQLWKRVGRIGSVRIWWDEALARNQVFDRAIQERIDKSALFVALTSPGYFHDQSYGLKELQWFYAKAQREPYGLAVGDRARIFNVQLRNIDYRQWPTELGGSSGFPFHDARHDDEVGLESEPGRDLFRSQLRALADAIHRTLVAMQESHVERLMPHSTPRVEAADPFPVYVADTSDSLRNHQKRLVNELLRNGLQVSTGVPPPFESNAHEEAVSAKAREAKLSVHLFDEFPGREIDGDRSSSYPRKQLELSLAHSPSQLIWVPQNLSFATVGDVEYGQFLDKLENEPRSTASYSFVRGMGSSIVQDVLQKVQELRAQSVATERLPQAVLLDTHIKDQLHALDLGRFFLARGIQPYINPEEDDPKRNIEAFENRMKQVGMLVILYGGVSEEWVRARLGVALQIAVRKRCSPGLYGIYLAPPRKAAGTLQFDLARFPIHVMDNSSGFDPETITPLLQKIGGGVHPS